MNKRVIHTAQAITPILPNAYKEASIPARFPSGERQRGRFQCCPADKKPESNFRIDLFLIEIIIIQEKD